MHRQKHTSAGPREDAKMGAGGREQDRKCSHIHSVRRGRRGDSLQRKEEECSLLTETFPVRVCKVKVRSTPLLYMYYVRVYINTQPSVHNVIWLLRSALKHASKNLSFPACNIQEEAICHSITSIFHILTEQSQMAWHSATSRHLVEYSIYVLKWDKKSRVARGRRMLCQSVIAK